MSCTADLEYNFPNCSSALRSGWTSSPDVRGSFSILWSSLFTIFLCTWTVLCLNVPAPSDTYWRQMRRKFTWSLITVFGPEFLVSFVIGHLAAAKRSVKGFHALGYTKWTLRHAFYADMGGFLLKPSDFPAFPVNSVHIQWLVHHNYIPFPSTTTAEIEDKSKADAFAKTITLLQTTWFLLQCIGRAIQHLPITTLELSTLAFVFCTLPTYYFWWQKPLDVFTPTTLEYDVSIAKILLEAGTLASEPYQQTPLDFIDDLTPSWSLTVMPHFGSKDKPVERPITRMPNDRLPNIDYIEQMILFTITCFYSAIHLFGWNFSFATEFEKYMWRASAITHLVATFLFWVVDRHQSWHRRGYYDPMWQRLWYPRRQHVKRVNTLPQPPEESADSKTSSQETLVNDHASTHTSDDSDFMSVAILASSTDESADPPVAKMGEKSYSRKSSIMSEASSRQKESVEGYTSYVVPKYEFIFMFIVTCCYGIARLFLIVELFLAFRSLPVRAYADVNWASFVPHF